MERQAPFLDLIARKIKVLRKSLVRQNLAAFGRTYGHEALVALFIEHCDRFDPSSLIG